MKNKDLKEKGIVKVAYWIAKVQANSGCVLWAYQEKTPESVRRLRKF